MIDPMNPKIIFMMWVSGSWKTTVMKELLKDERFVYVPSCSTRAIRVHDGESQWHPYWFLTVEEFEKAKENGEFLEWAMVHNRDYYGSRYKDLMDVIDQWKWPIKEIDIHGLIKIKDEAKIDGKYVSIFFDIDDLVMTQRIFKRQPDIDDEELQRRLQSAGLEREKGNELCDFVMDASGNVPEVVDEVMDIIENKVMWS